MQACFGSKHNLLFKTRCKLALLVSILQGDAGDKKGEQGCGLRRILVANSSFLLACKKHIKIFIGLSFFHWNFYWPDHYFSFLLGFLNFSLRSWFFHFFYWYLYWPANSAHRATLQDNINAALFLPLQCCYCHLIISIFSNCTTVNHKKKYKKKQCVSLFITALYHFPPWHRELFCNKAAAAGGITYSRSWMFIIVLLLSSNNNYSNCTTVNHWLQLSKQESETSGSTFGAHSVSDRNRMITKKRWNVSDRHCLWDTFQFFSI